jgi:hypothetical protein
MAENTSKSSECSGNESAKKHVWCEIERWDQKQRDKREVLSE